MPEPDNSETNPSTGRLGVLFVHGIGTRKEASALVAGTEPIFSFLSGWLKDSGGIAVEEASLFTSVTNENPQVVLDVATTSTGQLGTWVLREAWWGGSISSPKYLSILAWAWIATARSAWQLARPLVAAIWQAALEVIGQFKEIPELGNEVFVAVASSATGLDPELLGGHFETPEREGRSEEDVRLALLLGRPEPSLGQVLGSLGTEWFFGSYRWAVMALVAIFFVVSIPLAVVAIMLTGLVAVASIPLVVVLTLAVWLFAPIPTIGTWARNVQDALRNSVGDAFIWERKPLLRNVIQTTVRKELAAIAAECDEVAIVAHSQGAAVVYDMLNKQEQLPRELSLVVTYGQGIGRLSPRRQALKLPSGWSEHYAWHDYCATRDPVSVQPLSGPLGVTSAPIVNLRSVVQDHSAYWANDEGFVAPLALMLNALAKGQETSEDELRLAELGYARRLERVGLLTTARLEALLFVAAVVVFFDAPTISRIASATNEMVGVVTEFLPFVARWELDVSWLAGLRAYAIAVVALGILVTGWFIGYSLVWRGLDARERKWFRSRDVIPTRSFVGFLLTIAQVLPVVAFGLLAVLWRDSLKAPGTEPLLDILIWTGVILLMGTAIIFSFAAPSRTARLRRAAEESARQEELEERVTAGLARLDSFPEPVQVGLRDYVRKNPKVQMEKWEVDLLVEQLQNEDDINKDATIAAD